MDIFLPAFWSAVFSIVIIDLVLAGDNAIVIGLAARNVPKEQQKKVIIWGTVGAIVVRSIFTILVVYLLKIPGLMLLGGFLLIWIAFKLLVEEKKHDNLEAGNSMWSAIKTIIIADAVMGLDNVLAVAGAAQGSFLLVIVGLLISIPIVVWGSTIILRWLERYPAILYLGAGILAFTAAKMITGEPLLLAFFADKLMLKWALVG
ncbi:MAG: TerC family protein, partial [Syntrophomonas sp.]|nr:TerC family protein [Syntrophomonas sp.]